METLVKTTNPKDKRTLINLQANVQNLLYKVTSRYNVEDPDELETKLGEPLFTIYSKLQEIVLEINETY